MIKCRVTKETEFTLYEYNYMDLKIRVYDKEDHNEVYVNYKGYNPILTMMMWDFYKDLDFASLEGVRWGGESDFDYFICENKDLEELLDEIYFFLGEHNIYDTLTLDINKDLRLNW